MWVAYARTEDDARALEARLLEMRVGTVVWVAWEMAPRWVEVDG